MVIDDFAAILANADRWKAAEAVLAWVREQEAEDAVERT